MAFFDRRLDIDADSRDTTPSETATYLLLITIAVLVAVLFVMAVVFQPTGELVAGAKAGSSLKTVATQPSPPIATPDETTAPRPTQAPIQ